MIKLTSQKLDKTLTDSTKKVFETMLQSKIDLKHALPQSPPPIFGERRVITSSVGFSGMILGMIYFYMEESVAMIIAGRFLQMEPDELKEEGDATIYDTLGEFANMTVGGFKNRLGDEGYTSTLTLPSIVKGIGLKIVNTNAELTRFYIFEFEGMAVLAYLSLGYGDSFPG